MIYNVLQERWLMWALIGGSAVVLGFILAYLAIWRGRAAEGQAPAAATSPAARALAQRSFFGWVGSFVPWLLIVVIVGLLVYAVVYTISRMFYPPNW